MTTPDKAGDKAKDDHADHGSKSSPFLGVGIFAAVCLVIAIMIPMAMNGIGDGVLGLSTKLSMSAGAVNSQRNAIVGIGVACGIFFAALLGGIAFGLSVLIAALSKNHSGGGAHAAAH